MSNKLNNVINTKLAIRMKIYNDKSKWNFRHGQRCHLHCHSSAL